VLSLSSLAGWEEAVLASVAGASGTVEERDAQVERSGLYGEYPAIVHAYIELFSDPESALEAVKRAYFLVWRSAMALPADSGIPPLPDGTIRVVVDELDARARREPIDPELQWMLARYHALGPSVLELYGATPRLIDIAERGGPESWREARFAAAAMKGRGQMGRYWSALSAGAP
jgi:hypothetical protein